MDNISIAKVQTSNGEVLTAGILNEPDKFISSFSKIMLTISYKQSKDLLPIAKE